MTHTRKKYHLKKDYGQKIEKYLSKKKPEKRERLSIQRYYLEPHKS